MTDEHDYVGQAESEHSPPLDPATLDLSKIVATVNDLAARLHAIENSVNAINSDVKSVTGVDIEAKVGAILGVLETHLGVKL